MTFWDVTVVISGWGTTDSVTTKKELDTYLDVIREEAERDNSRVEVYVLHHDHALEVDYDECSCECSCSQCVTDHHPTYVFNKEGDFRD